MKDLSDLLDEYDPFEYGILDNSIAVLSKIHEHRENRTIWCECNENASISDDKFLEENDQYQILFRKAEDIKHLKTENTSLKKQNSKTAKKNEIANTKSKIASKTSPKTNPSKLKSKDTQKKDSSTIKKEPEHIRRNYENDMSDIIRREVLGSLSKNEATSLDPKMYSLDNCHDLKIPINVKQNTGTAFGWLFGRRNSKKSELGAWLILPTGNNQTTPPSSDQSDTIILYLHGEGGNRATPQYRSGMYKALQTLGYPVLAIDYRGFGDSVGLQGHPTKTSMTMDAIAALTWLQQKFPRKQILVWGHSLGAAIACQLEGSLKSIPGQIKRPCGYVLEAPFRCMGEAIMYKHTNEFQKISPSAIREKSFYRDILTKLDLYFQNFEAILNVRQPIFIMHAKDDIVIPFRQSFKLFEEGVEHKLHIKLIEFEEGLTLGHNSIYKCNELSDIIQKVEKDIKLSQVSSEYLEFHGHDGHHWHNGHRIQGT